MFGLTHKISDSSLYLLHDMVESMLLKVEHNLQEIPKEKTTEIAQLLLTIAYYKQELQKFEDDILEQRKHYFQFSVEELYNSFGQYDIFVGIEFHKHSEAAKKFGRNIGGIFVYGKKERQNLEETINTDNIPRTNGLVKIDVSSNYKLSNEQIKDLLEVGFSSSDIYVVSSTNTPLVNTYAQKGKKEIPYTINIDFDTSDVDPCKLSLYTFNLRLGQDGVLINGEWDEYCGYNLYYSPEIKNDKLLKGKIYNTDGTKRKEVRFYELVAKQRNSDIKEDELKEFSILLKNRRIERFEILEDELRKAGINSIDKFKAEHSEIYKEIHKTALIFSDDVLTFTKTPTPVYWDFRSYLHIYLRHCDELQPDGHFKDKTSFAYKQKDIRRILSIAVEKLQDKIQARLAQGLDFRTFGEKALYFNGNYYSMRIESNGRIDSFHPNELK